MTHTKLLRLFFAGFIFIALPHSVFSQKYLRFAYSNATENYNPIQNGTTLNLKQGTGLSTVINLGFNFSYNDIKYSQVKASRYGYLTFNLADSTTDGGNIGGYNLRVMPFWDNFGIDNAVLRYKTEGAAPNRIFIFEWSDVNYADSTSLKFSFQAKLYETLNKIEFSYKTDSTPVGNDLISASIGVIGQSPLDFYTVAGYSYIRNDDWVYYTNSQAENNLLIKFEPTTECQPPYGYNVTDITPHSAKFYWNRDVHLNANQFAWKIEDAHTQQKYDSGIISFYQDSVLTNNLPANTDFIFSMRGICGADTGDVAYPLTFTTPQVDPTVVNFPYTQSFESGVIDLGWDNYKNQSYFWTITDTDSPNGTKKAFIGNKFLRFDASSTVNSDKDYFEIRTALFKLDAKTKRLKYNYWFGKNANKSLDGERPTLEVLTIDPNTYNAPRILLFAHDSGNSKYNLIDDSSWTQQSIDLTGYENKEINLIFRTSGKKDLTEVANIDIDNIIVEDAACAAPVNVKTSGNGASNVRIQWTNGLGQKKWEIEYDTAGFTIGSGKKIIVTSSPYNLQNLLPAQNYQFYIRAVCDGNIYSDRAGPIGFKTLDTYITTFPYRESFENGGQLPVGWNFNPEVQPTDNPKFLKSDTRTVAHTGNYYVNMITAYLRSTSYLQSRGIQLNDKIKRLRYFYKFLTYDGIIHNNCDFGYDIQISTDNENWLSLYTHDCNNSYFDTNSNWFQNTIDLSAYTNQAVFFRINPGSGDVNFSVDDFIVEDYDANTIPVEPISPNVSKLNDDNSVLLAWTKGNNETSWEVEYGRVGFVQGTGTVLNVTGLPQIKIQNVPSNEAFEYYVRGVYGVNKKSLWSGPINYSYNYKAFYDITADNSLGSLPWKTALYRLNAGVEFYGNSAVFSTASSYKTQMYLFSPRILNLKDKTHHLTFIARKNTPGGRMKLEIGLVSDPGFLETYKPIQLLDLNAAKTPCEIKFDNYTGDNQFIVFKYVQANPEDNFAEVYVDSISWEKIKTCETPIDLKTTKLNPSNATFNWSLPANAIGTPSGYKWKIFKSENTSPYEKPIQFGVTTTNAVSVIGLNPQTAYYFYVQSFCSNINDTSTYWSAPLKIITPVVNDACDGAIEVSIAGSLDQAQQSPTIVHRGLYRELPDQACQGFYNDVWHKFTTSSTDTFPISIFALAGFTNDWVMNIYKGDCNALQLVDCNDDFTIGDYSAMPRLTLAKPLPNTTYYIRLSPKTRDDIDSCKLLVFCANNCPAYKYYDVCSTAGNFFTVRANSFPFTNKNTSINIQPRPICEPTDSIYDIWIGFDMSGYIMSGILNAAYKFSNLEAGKNLKYALYKGTCNNLIPIDCGTVKENGEFFLIGIEENQKYFLRVWSNKYLDEGNFTLTTTLVQLKSEIQLANAVTTTACRAFGSVVIDETNSNRWVPLMDNTQLVAEINANGNLLRQVSGSYYRNSGVIRKINNIAYLDRNIGIAAQNQPTTPVDVRLYLTDTEYQAYKIAVGGDMSFGITHYAGAVCTPVANNTSADLLPATLEHFRDNAYYIQFQTKSFSEFFVSMNKLLTALNEVKIDNQNLVLKNLYPNPANDKISLVFEIQNTESVEISITDISGRILLKQKKQVSFTNTKIDLGIENFESGIYFINIKSSGANFTRKIVVSK